MLGETQLLGSPGSGDRMHASRVGLPAPAHLSRLRLLTATLTQTNLQTELIL